MRKEIDIFSEFNFTMEQLKSSGLLLVSGEKGNPMTIGWASFGIIWKKPELTVLVRPSRYSHSLLEELDYFSVNVPSKALRSKVMICGMHSGKDIDKIKECKFTLMKGIKIPVPYIKECSFHYECRIIHKNKVIKDTLAESIISSFYSSGDFHTIYFSEILGAYKEE